MADELGYKRRIQGLVQLDDIQNLSNFHLKVVEKVITKKGSKDNQVEK